MDESLRKKLVHIGINVEEALGRMLGREEFYIQLLKKFALDDNYEKLGQALKDRDLEAAFKAAHTLKGLSGNLSITVLFDPVTEITDALRNKDVDRALAYMQSFSPLYIRVIAGINSL
jgi:HPt (histidine-containing phosphotransfer) domain-containing protein